MVADYDAARAREGGGRGDDRFVGGAGRRLGRRSRWRRSCREHGITHVMNAVDPRLQHADLRRRVRGRCRLPRHGDVAVAPAPRGAVRESGVKLGDEQFAKAGDWERRGRLALVGHRRRARALRRVRAVRRRPPVLRDRRARHPRRRQPRRHRRRRQRDLRAVVLDVDHDRGVPQPAGDLGERTSTAAGSPPRRSASRRSSTSPRASARSSASTSSTRRCCSCRAGSTASARRSSTASATSSSTSSRCCTRSASTAPRRSGSRASRSVPRDVVAAVPARPGHARPDG